MGNGEFIGVREASRRLGVHPRTLRRRVLSGDLQTFTNPLDARTKLIRARDLEELMRPQPVQPAEAAATAA
jgi:hypothetical protein